MKSRRHEYACILAPALPLQALVRSEPDLADRLVATVDGEGTRAAITHACHAAWQAGLRPGMTPSQARSIAPEAVLRRVPECVTEAAAQALLDVALAVSPRVQALRPGAVAMDIAGTDRLYPSRPALGCAVQSAAGRTGLRVRVAVSSGPRLALIAARASPGVTIVPPGGEAAFMAPMALAALDPSPDLAATFSRLGLRTIGDLAALDRRGMGIRLGPEAFGLHRLARGEDATRLEPVVPAETFEEAASLDYVLDNAEPLLFLLAASLERLVARVEARQAAPGGLRVALDLDPAGVHVVEVSMPAPTGDVRSLMGLLRLALDASPPPAPVRGFRVLAHPGPVKPVQGFLFGPPVPEPSAMAALLTRLAVLAGPDAVGTPAVADSHGRDEAAMAPFGVRAPGSWGTGGTAGIARAMPVMAFRRFRPPVEVAVREHDDAPCRVDGGDLSGPVSRAAGPWYSDSAWWTDRPQAGATWDVEVRGRGLFRLWHDMATGRWYADGAYD